MTHSRASFYRTAASARRLFGESGRIDLGSLSLTYQMPPAEPRHSDHLKTIGTILHERTHWLQAIGTTVGTFSSLVSGQQGAAAQVLITALGSELTVRHLPLLDSLPGTPELHAWQALEYLHRLMFPGEDRSELESLPKFGLQNAFYGYAASVRLILSKLCPAATAPSIELQIDQMPKKYSLVADDFGKPIGTEELMETAARLGEYWRWAADYDGQEGRGMINRVAFFQGRWHAVWAFYYERVQTESFASDFALALLIDYALNPPIPPYFPTFLAAELLYNPMIRFALGLRWSNG